LILDLEIYRRCKLKLNAMKRVTDLEFYNQLKELGYHIPDHCTELKLDAPMNSPVYVTCTYMLYKNESPEEVVKSSMLNKL
jgi:hypothetical protein